MANHPPNATVHGSGWTTVNLMGVLDEPFEPLTFDCPRCTASVTTEFYGPCAACLSELRLRYQAESSEIEKVAYEPKMNVTPNAVALKDD
jgi:hypothetical protein